MSELEKETRQRAVFDHCKRSAEFIEALRLELSPKLVQADPDVFHLVMTQGRAIELLSRAMNHFFEQQQ